MSCYIVFMFPILSSVARNFRGDSRAVATFFVWTVLLRMKMEPDMSGFPISFDDFDLTFVI